MLKNSNFIDTHCHLNDEIYTQNLPHLLDNAASLGLSAAIIPGVDVPSLKSAKNLAERYGAVYFAVGIHPNYASEFSEENLAILESYATHPKCVAVGEIGLDYYRLDSSIEAANAEIAAQKSVFRGMLELAIKHKKPIIIHTRESNADVIEILKEYESDLKSVIFHCFGGDLGLVDALKCPCYYGIGGVVSFKNAQNLRDSLRFLARDSIVLETDAPYLAPTPYRGKTNSPEYIPLIAKCVAESLDLELGEVYNLTTQNAKNAFGL